MPIFARSVVGRPTRAAWLARSWIALAVGGGLFVLAGCSSSQTSDVSTVANEFYSAVAEGDGTGACVVLSADARTRLEQASGKACPEAVLGEDLPEPDTVDLTRVYGTMALVSADGDTMFLSRFPRGWLVTAVGCRLTDQADRYDCTVSGG